MTTFKIRHACEGDYEKILKIYERARRFMAEHGNPNQWNTKWPPADLVWDDILQQRNYVCCLAADGTGDPADEAVGVFVYLQGVDIEPTYMEIHDGQWADPSEYGVVHRIASSGEVPGVGEFCLNWCYDRCRHMRIDTHGDNVVMMNLLEKCGFRKQGVIYVLEDNYPRMAYEKSDNM